MENIETTKEYFDRLHEAGKKGPAAWIVCSPKVAKALNKLQQKEKHGRKK